MSKSKGESSFLIATDGSKASKDCFLQCLELMGPDSHIYVVHISDSSKSYLPHEFKPTTIYQDYKSECLSRLPARNYDLIFEEKNEELGIRKQILLFGEKLKTNFIVIGYHGRKGVKSDSSIMGSNTKGSVTESKLPIVIVKSLIPRNVTNKGFGFLSCLDGSDKALRTMETVARLADPKTDQVYVCTVIEAFDENGQKLKLIEEGFSLKAMEFPEFKWQFFKIEKSLDPSKALCDFIHLNEKVWIDFVAFGNNGYRAQKDKGNFLGKTAENLITQLKVNPILLP